MVDDKQTIRLLQATEDTLLAQVIAMGDAQKRWLGPLSRAAFAEYAARENILVAVAGDTVLGYALFALPRQEVRLAHLCVHPDSQGRGFAKDLVDHLSKLHEHRRGIKVRCRRDWPADSAWPHLGFSVLSNRPGRSSAGHLLTTWWRDHGHPDLFSVAAAENPRILVAMDTNVFRDLHEPNRGSGAEQSQALQADWLSEEIELVLTPGIGVELNGHPDPRARESLLAIANSGTYRTVGEAGARAQETAASLQSAIVSRLHLSAVAKDPSLLTDARLLAEADAGMAEAFVSRDANAVAELADASAGLTDVWVYTPTDLIVHLDELRDATNYAPAQLLNTGYSVSQVEAGGEDQLGPLLNHADGETSPQFRRAAREAAQHVGHTGTRMILRDPQKETVAGAFFTGDMKTLTVSLLRVANTKLAKTIAVQLLYLIRESACEKNADRVAVTDRHVSPAIRAALLESGYRRVGDGFIADVIRGQFTWAETVTALPTLASARNSAGALSQQEAAELERVLWPLKILDAPLPCFLIPIKPAPATALFGQEPTLWNSSPELGLSRQHAYFRAPTPQVLEAPGRILWYVSNPTMEVVAASRLEQAVVGHPGTLHRKFRRLAVLDRAVIEQVSKRGRAMAVLFSDTEFFRSPVPLRRLREIDCRLDPLPSPRRISAESFFKVYEEGEPS